MQKGRLTLKIEIGKHGGFRLFCDGCDHGDCDSVNKA